MTSTERAMPRGYCPDRSLRRRRPGSPAAPRLGPAARLWSVETRRWFNNTQPQTLQAAQMLLYFNAILSLLFGGLASGVLIALAVGDAAGAFGIANERKWGYWLAVVVAIVPLASIAFVVLRYGVGAGLSVSILNLIFQIALVALLLHRQSRDYQRIWFK